MRAGRLPRFSIGEFQCFPFGVMMGQTTMEILVTSVRAARGLSLGVTGGHRLHANLRAAVPLPPRHRRRRSAFHSLGCIWALLVFLILPIMVF